MPKAMNRDLRIHLTAGNDAEFRMQVAEIAEALTRIGTLELLKYGDDIPCCLACGGVRYVAPPGCKQTGPKFPSVLLVYDGPNRGGTTQSMTLARFLTDEPTNPGERDDETDES